MKLVSSGLLYSLDGLYRNIYYLLPDFTHLSPYSRESYSEFIRLFMTIESLYKAAKPN